MSHQDLAEEAEAMRRRCGCLRASDMLKEALAGFPTPPPPPPSPSVDELVVSDTKYPCISVYCAQEGKPHRIWGPDPIEPFKEPKDIDDIEEPPYTFWSLLVELFRMLQVSVVVTALLAYYVLYFYVQLLYVTFRSVVYFHNVDGPMKVTIGVITATSLLVAFNLFLKIERLLCFH
ncbi:uncharacterized protein LOC121734883 [Aricia agestis]|uniref:uncharacterized protein LOC121734883 n=1 Tax=Aricia agestis TaxID=91739 RepID=UPI001C2032A8|nr:uncharacterized protein LOC121734883 [Aricia agestis]